MPPDGVGLPALSGGFFPEHKCQISLAQPLALVFISAKKCNAHGILGGGLVAARVRVRWLRASQRCILWQKLRCETLRPAPRLHGEVVKRRLRPGRPKLVLLRLPYSYSSVPLGSRCSWDLENFRYKSGIWAFSIVFDLALRRNDSFRRAAIGCHTEQQP